MKIRINILVLSLLFPASLLAQKTVAGSKYQQDFNYFWNTINEQFAYFDKQKTDWKKVKELYQPQVDTITTKRSFVELLERINHELYNGHISLNTNLPTSSRLIPTGADIWVGYRNRQILITSVREGSAAEKSGLKAGMRITHFNDEKIDSAIKEFLPISVKWPDVKMYEYAANTLLAGRYHIKRKITVLDKAVSRIFYPDSSAGLQQHEGLLEVKIIEPGIGYIRINNSLGNNELIKAFDKALDSLFNTGGLIIDLRETPSGGNTTVARAIMGRFIQQELPYQKHSLPAEEKNFGVKRSWIEYVSPRLKTYTKPLVILVNRWTGSMGEGLAIGFDGMKRGAIVGERMAGLLGAIYSYQMPETNIGFSFPVEKLFHVNGKPREDFIPAFYETDGKKQLDLALKLLKKQIK